jgi:hypothetical protein
MGYEWVTILLIALFVGLTIFQLWTGKTFNSAFDLFDRKDRPDFYIYTVCLTSACSIFLLVLLLLPLFHSN